MHNTSNTQNNPIPSNNISATILPGSVTTGNLVTSTITSVVNWTPQKTYWNNICLDDELPKLIKTQKQFDVLKNILIQKGILTEEEIDDAINAMELMDEMIKET